MSTPSVPWTFPTVTSSTNLGPLLTPLTLPSDCLSKLWDFGTPGLLPSAQQSYTYLTQGCAISSCCPSSAPYSEAYQWLTTYYSPAVCPVSYKNCAGPSDLTPGPSETTAFCCPVNYDCPSSFSLWWACQSGLSSAIATMYGIDPVYTQQTVSTKVTTFNDIWAVAYPIQIRWQQEDLASFSSAAMQITTETSSSTETQPVSTSSTASQNTSGVSIGAKAGIGIGVGAKVGIGIGIGAIFVVILVTAIFWVRRNGHRLNELDGAGVVRTDSNNVGAREHNSLQNPNEFEGGRVELAGD